MKCFYCQKEMEDDGIFLNADGDFVCDEICKKAYETARDDFFDRIVHDEDLTKRWILGENV